MTYILYLITLFAFIVSLIAAVYYFRKYNKIRNRLPDIDGEEELMKPYNLLMQELEQKQQQLKQQSLQHHLLVKAIKLKLWKWDLKRKEIIWEGNLEKGEQGTVVVDVDEHLSHVPRRRRRRWWRPSLRAARRRARAPAPPRRHRRPAPMRGPCARTQGLAFQQPVGWPREPRRSPPARARACSEARA